MKSYGQSVTVIEGDTVLVLTKIEAVSYANTVIENNELKARNSNLQQRYSILEQVYDEVLNSEAILLTKLSNEQQQKAACFTQLNNTETENERLRKMFKTENRTTLLKGGAIGIVIGIVGFALISG